MAVGKGKSARIPKVQQSGRTRARLRQDSLLLSARVPVKGLVSMGLREGRHSRPIYQIHKWFARRLGCVFRALLVSATTSSKGDFWKAYYGEGDLTGKAVLDLFVGGGTSVVEAARLGASVYGSDIDPIAVLITQAELSAAKIPPLEDALASLSKSVGASLARHYRTWDERGDELTALHYFWVQQVKCGKCGKVNDCHPNHFLGADEGGNWVFCKGCGGVRRLGAGDSILRCGCGTRTDVWSGPVDRAIITCPGCGHEEALIEYSKRTKTRPKWKLFAVEALRHMDGQKSVPIRDRLFVQATDKDVLVHKAAARELRKYVRSAKRKKVDFAIPRQGRSDRRLEGYGYRSWEELFNPRQLLHLYKLADAIRALDADTRHWMGLAFSNHLTTNCMMTAYAGKWRRLTPIFSIRAFRHVPRPIEINPWLDGTGRGTYVNAVRQIEAAQRYSQRPTEPPRDSSEVYVAVPPRSPEGAPIVRKCNAERLAHVKGGSIDVVLSDPPYYDNIEYSSLADFFAPWLEYLGLLKGATRRATVKKKTLKARRGHTRPAIAFANRLGNAFREMERVLRPGGLAVFTYRHSTAEGWLALAKAIARCGLEARTVFPIPGEAGANMHVRGNSGRWDAVIVLRKGGRKGRPARGRALRHVDAAAARAAVGSWVQRLEGTADFPFSNADALNLTRATLVAAALGMRVGRPKSKKEEHSALGEALAAA